MIPATLSQKDPRHDLAYWLAWSILVQGRALRKLFDHFADGRAAWQTSPTELERLGFQPATTEKIEATRPTLAPEQLLENTHRQGLEVVLLTDPAYPPLLKELYDAPVILFYFGRLPLVADRPLAVVGTRAVTPYGQAAATTLVRDLAAQGLTIVSGLARGIDALAHQATLEVGGKTVAVLGSGLADADVYPHEHLKLAHQIVEHEGALLSEYPPGVGPDRHHFPERNRIIAGLTLGTLVIEAPETSGALITARLALEYNREVLAVPGSIFERTAAGTNELLKLGARPVTSAADVLEALNVKAVKTTTTPRHDFTDVEATLLNALSKQPLHVDSLRQTTGLESASLGSALTLLELKGVVRDIGGKRYIKLD